MCALVIHMTLPMKMALGQTPSAFQHPAALGLAVRLVVDKV